MFTVMAMLSDRSYMRPAASQRTPSFLAWFAGTLIGVFVLDLVFERWFGSDALFRHGALSSHGLRDGEVWSLLTYALLHGNLTHLVVNILGLFFVGRALQDTLGARRLGWLTAAGALGGAAAWLAAHFSRGDSVVGASAVVMAYLTVFACINPWRRMTVLLFFILPLTIQPVWLMVFLGGIDLLGFVTQELPGSGSLHGFAHSAHLGGMAAGWLFHRLVIARPRASSGPVIEPPAWLRKRSVRPAPVYTLDLDLPPPSGAGNDAPRPSAAAPGTYASREALRAEVDRILDKISLQGVGALTDAEKRVLDEARQQLSHR